MRYLHELFTGMPRGGPGTDECTAKAVSFMKDLPKNPRILDIGCGPGKQTLVLAGKTGGHVIALDNFRPFLDQLTKDAKERGLDGHIEAVLGDMNDMGYAQASFDVVWAEGSLFIMGFDKGLKECHRLLRTGGYAGVTEAAYLNPAPPTEVLDFWEREYPAITTLDGNLELAMSLGFDVVSHFVLPPEAWLKNFYVPLEKKIHAMEQRRRDDPAALEFLKNMRAEAKMYRDNWEHFGYVFMVLRKR